MSTQVQVCVHWVMLHLQASADALREASAVALHIFMRALCLAQVKDEVSDPECRGVATKAHATLLRLVKDVDAEPPKAADAQVPYPGRDPGRPSCAREALQHVLSRGESQDKGGCFVAGHGFSIVV